MNLSDNLSLAEAISSATALRKGIANKPTQQHLLNLKEVALHIFQPCREHFGKPLRVTSGYRSEELNKAIGGSSKSQHSKGEALDMQSTKGYTNKELFMFIKDHLNFDQLIGEFPDNVGELLGCIAHIRKRAIEVRYLLPTRMTTTRPSTQNGRL
jgi:zinc D-Ala-D-Ala carboxypeptidase